MYKRLNPYRPMSPVYRSFKPTAFLDEPDSPVDLAPPLSVDEESDGSSPVSSSAEEESSPEPLPSKMVKPNLPEQRKPNPARETMLKHRQQLPIYSAKQPLLKEIRANKSVIIIGETGSGKTTQIPQFIWEECKGFGGGIAVTQPRRLAAMTTAQRVAEEMGVTLGGLVGYNVRFDDKTSPQTRVTFLTDGMLVRECMVNPTLKNYKVIILDEAHERSVHTDILCALVANVQRTSRPDLKILIMSATLSSDLFEKYFNAKTLYVQGRQFPVTVLYTKTPESNYVDATVTTILQIHLDQPTGDILAFLTGREEIENVAKLLQQKIKLFPPEAKTLLICPLYAAQSNDQQRKAFEQTPSGCRKVIIATNIAETSLTVPNIKYVVDCGLVKMKTRAAKPSDGLRKSLMVNILSVTPISHEQAWQRAGRAGRTQPGVCYRLYQETAFAKLDKSQVPEIRRIDLTTLVLQLMVIGIKDVINFPYLEAPDKTAVGGALAHLFKLGAIDRHRNVTELGRQMALFPVDPALAKVLITSKANRCSDQILSIIAMLNVENIFHLSNYKGAGTSEMNSANSGPNGSTGSAIGSRKTGQDEDTNARSSVFEAMDQAKKAFTAVEGDHMSYLNIFNGYMAARDKKRWCKEHQVNQRSMVKVLEIRDQLVGYWEGSAKWRLEKDNSSMEEVSDNIRKTFLSGFFENVAFLMPNGQYQNFVDQEEVAVHPSSYLARAKPPCVFYNELVLTSRMYMRGVSQVDQKWLLEIAPHTYQQAPPPVALQQQ